MRATMRTIFFLQIAIFAALAETDSGHEVGGGAHPGDADGADEAAGGILQEVGHQGHPGSVGPSFVDQGQMQIQGQGAGQAGGVLDLVGNPSAGQLASISALAVGAVGAFTQYNKNRPQEESTTEAAFVPEEPNFPEPEDPEKEVRRKSTPAPRRTPKAKRPAPRRPVYKPKRRGGFFGGFGGFGRRRG